MFEVGPPVFASRYVETRELIERRTTKKPVFFSSVKIIFNKIKKSILYDVSQKITKDTASSSGKKNITLFYDAISLISL